MQAGAIDGLNASVVHVLHQALSFFGEHLELRLRSAARRADSLELFLRARDFDETPECVELVRVVPPDHQRIDLPGPYRVEGFLSFRRQAMCETRRLLS
jgi:hypothetical protein